MGGFDMADLIIITGGSSGIGRYLAESALAGGVAVATVSRQSGPGHHLAADLSNPAWWPTVIGWMTELVGETEHRHISFIHNAGTLNPIGFAGEVDLDAYAANVVVNAAAGQVLGAGFLAAMAGRREPANGLLIMMSSGAAVNAYPGWSSYCAAKAGLEMWVQVVAQEQEARSDDGGSAVTVAAVAPGVVATGMQALIREQDERDFPQVARFRELDRKGELVDPAKVAEDFRRLINRHAADPSVIEQGWRGHIADLDLG